MRFPGFLPALGRAAGLVWIALFSLFLASGCGQQRLLKKNPRLQHFTDRTATLLPKLHGLILGARFARADGDDYPDLLILKPGRAPVLEVWLNKQGERFVPADRFWKGKPGDRVTDLEVGDFDRDGRHDVILVGRFADGARARLLSNNGRGYFYESVEKPQLLVRDGMRRVDVLDLDSDQNPDILFYGEDVRGKDGNPAPHQVQFFLNQGEGRFQDRTRLLWPPLRPGIQGAVYADYDGDQTLDVFIYYSNGRNVLLFNNGLGKLTDLTAANLPAVQDQTVHADWADFDQDGDNDLLVINRSLARRDRAYPKEFHYALENNGRGYFRKRAVKALPPFPATGVYLLDADGDEWPDTLLVTPKRTHYLRGAGPWKFSLESKKRLPGGDVIRDLTFADVDDNSYLDFFGVTVNGGEGRLWLNEF
ncbi:MAG: FG-GAP repeat domain-containing protein [Nitrospinaceae bacterium]